MKHPTKRRLLEKITGLLRERSKRIGPAADELNLLFSELESFTAGHQHLRPTIARIRQELDRALSSESTLQTMLDSQTEWGATAWQELQRTNDLLLTAEKSASDAQQSRERIASELERERALRERLMDGDARAIHASLARLHRFSELGIPLFLRKDGTPAFQPQAGHASGRVVVLSIPKAGTYMLGELLGRLGYQNSAIHGADWGFTDLRFSAGDQAFAGLEQRNHFIPLEEYIDCVTDGDFILTHLPHTESVLNSVSDFRRIFLIRNIRDCYVSFMRFSVSKNLISLPEGWSECRSGAEQMTLYAQSDVGRDFFQLANAMKGWRCDSGTVTIRYEDLMGDNGEEAESASRDQILSITGSGDQPIDLSAIRSTQTLTKSESRSHWSEWWSESTEAKFQEFGGVGLNTDLGYEHTMKQAEFP